MYQDDDFLQMPSWASKNHQLVQPLYNKNLFANGPVQYSYATQQHTHTHNSQHVTITAAGTLNSERQAPLES